MPPPQIGNLRYILTTAFGIELLEVDRA